MRETLGWVDGGCACGGRAGLVVLAVVALPATSGRKGCLRDVGCGEAAGRERRGDKVVVARLLDALVGQAGRVGEKFFGWRSRLAWWGTLGP